MRPINISYTPLDDTTDYFLAAATGEGPFTPSTTTTTDNLAHLPSLTSSADLSGIDITITGVDADGFGQTETLAGPNNNTVYFTKYFRMVTEVVASATLGEATMDVGIKDVSITQTIPVNHLQSSFSATQAVAVTGTINYTVQYTVGAIYEAAPSTLVWANHATLAVKTTSLDSVIYFPFRAVRVLINSLTAGATLTFTSLQTNGS